MTPRQRLLFGCILFLIIVAQSGHWFVSQQQAITFIAGEVARAEELNQETIVIAVGSDSDHTKDDQPNELESTGKTCERIHVNWATAQELQKLPGIGPVLASNIILARSEALFRVDEDLLRVTGIGPKRLEQIIGLICLDSDHVKPEN